MRPFLFLLILIIYTRVLNLVKCQQKVVYTFTEFAYKESAKNEAMFREYEATCEGGCSGKKGVSKVLCVRHRPNFLQLEEGEVDVRLNSFKGCFIQRYNRSRP
ncbi:ataxin 2-binding protein 1-related [Holotrichia oblita]|uniref:Ataxin 2-binding protein 1-related n=1 Tax=Holotrichia oblita TaxID=644536 RepID=A0ACB9TGC3_HOLOL|nr:ataxin 2-binding protein 1-related [Holotrichia oblita]